MTGTTKLNLNLRTAPNLGSIVLKVIPKGATVEVTGTSNNGFLPVTYDGVTGWASARYIVLSAASSYVERAEKLARSKLGAWYHFGANGSTNFDCSGFVGWVSEQCGYRPGSMPLYDYSADQMFDHFRQGVWRGSKVGSGFGEPMDIVFYGYGDHATHVVFALGGGEVIGASGGFRATKTDADAKRVGACVRIDRIGFHSHPIIGIYRPAYPKE